MNYLICKELELARQNYERPIKLVDGLMFSQRDTIKTIEFYSNSKYLNGQIDELGREKPFYNIGNAMCDVENAGKDLDPKDASITSDDGQHYMEAFLMSKDVFEWMKEVNFGKTLNDMRDMHTRYGSLLVKKCTYNSVTGEKLLTIEMPEWKNVITDQVDILSGMIVECHYLTPAKLLKKTSWDEKAIKEIVKKSIKMGYGHRIPVFEVRGEFPKSFIKELNGEKVTEKDETTFSYQLYYLAGEYTQQAVDQAQTTDSTFFAGKLTPVYWEDDTEQCYKYLPRKRKAGRAFGVGVLEEGEEAQVWTNDAVLKQFRAMEYTTKVIGQSASKRLKGRNLLTEVDDGTILEHEDNKPVTSVNLLPSGGLQQYENLINQWFTQFERATSAYSAQRGESPTSRTSFKLQAAVLQQSGSVIQDLQEELSIFIGEIFNEWIMPYLAKRLNKEHILSHDFSMDELREIDTNFSMNQANDMAKKMILSNQIVSVEQYDQFRQEALQQIQSTKNSRFLETPKNYYKKVKAKVTFSIGEDKRNRAATSETLLGIMKVYEANPALVQDPVLTQIFMRIIELSGAGISPISLIGSIQAKAKMASEKQPDNGKISESINYKDLPPEGQQQLAAKAGIKITQVAPSDVAPAQAPAGMPQ